MDRPQPFTTTFHHTHTTRRRFLRSSAAALSAAAAGWQGFGQRRALGAGPARTVSEAEVQRCHRQAPVLIGYMKPFIRYLPDGGMDATPFFACPEWSQSGFPRLQAGGVKAIMLSFGLNDPDLFPGLVGTSRVIQSIGAYLQAAEEHRDQIEVAHAPADLDRLLTAGKMAVLLHLTGIFLEGSLELLHAYHALGVRSVHPPFDNRSDPRADLWSHDAVLTDFDRRVIREMGRLRMLVDLAHASDAMIAEILAIVDGPVIVSHGMCRALCETKRNLSDEQIRAVARGGGVIGIHFGSPLIDEEYRRRITASGFYAELQRWQQEMKARYPDPFQYMAHRYDMTAWLATRAHELEDDIPLPPLAKIVDHVDHIVDLAGIDHVGVGTDYDLGRIPQEVDRADKLPNLTRELLRRGYSESDVAKIWGGNFLRVYRQVL